MTTHPEKPVHDLAIRLEEENRRLREALAAARRELATERYEHRHTIEARDRRYALLDKARSALRHVDTLLQGKSIYRDLLAEMDAALAGPADGEDEVAQADLDAADDAVAEGFYRDRGDVE